MCNFVELVTVLAEVLILVYFLNGIFGHPHRGHLIAYMIYILFGALLGILSLLPVNPLIRIMVLITCTVGISVYLYRVKLINSIYITIIYYFMAVAADIICSGILKSLGLTIQEQMSTADANRVIYIVVAKLCHLIGIQLVLAFFNRHKDEVQSAHTIPLMVGQVVSIFICYQLYLSMEAQKGSFFAIADIIGVLYINLIICHYIETIKILYKNKQEKEAAEQQLLVRHVYYEQVLKNQEETRALWHDIKKYIYAMQAIASKNDEVNIHACMKQVQESFANVRKVVDVGNYIVNSVLEYGLNQAEKANVKIEIDAWVPEVIDIAPVDLYVIIGNTIDNAIEACSIIENVQKRIVNIVLHNKNRMLYYEIQNPFSLDMPSKPGKIHGYGLRNVKRCVEKYNGYFVHKIVDGMFIVSIQLNTK